MKTITIDGIPVSEVSDAAEAVITKLQRQVADATALVATRDAEITTLKGEVSAKDGEIVVLRGQAEDAKIDPLKLDEMVTARSAVIDAAKKIAGDKLGEVKGLTDAQIRKAAVVARIGDAAKDMDDAAVSGAFRALTPLADAGADAVRGVMQDGVPPSLADANKRADDARSKMIADLNKAAA